jgi:hypothetical protein
MKIINHLVFFVQQLLLYATEYVSEKKKKIESIKHIKKSRLSSEVSCNEISTNVHIIPRDGPMTRL